MDKSTASMILDDTTFEKLKTLLSGMEKSLHINIGISHNHETVFDSSTKLLIIGTITPQDLPYYYCSQNKGMYKWISEKSETSFELPIDRIKRGYDSTKIRKDIIDFLKHEKIAFFDVIDKVIRRDHSSKDDDILFCTLDGGNLLKRLCNVKNNQNLIIIVNSNKALKMFYKILCNSEFVFEKRSKKSSEGSFQGYIHSAKDKKDIIAAVHLVSQSPIMTKYDVAKSWENAIGYVMSNRKDEEPFSDSLNFIIDSDSTSLLSMDNSKHVG